MKLKAVTAVLAVMQFYFAAAGIVATSIDGGPWRKTDLYHRYSRGLHYPRSVIFDADLKSGRHTLALRLTDQKNKGSRGTAMRIVKFVAN